MQKKKLKQKFFFKNVVATAQEDGATRMQRPARAPPKGHASTLQRDGGDGRARGHARDTRVCAHGARPAHGRLRKVTTLRQEKVLGRVRCGPGRPQKSVEAGHDVVHEPAP